VQNAGSWYECKPHPFTGWCNGAAWAYAPGVGTYWQDAWILKGSCTARADVSGQVAVEETISTDSDGISVSPNPGSQSSTHFTLNFTSVPRRIKIQVKDINGKDIVSQEFSDVKEKSIRVETPVLSPGMYLIRVQKDNGFSLKKYIVH
jgi:hypothetical protein